MNRILLAVVLLCVGSACGEEKGKPTSDVSVVPKFDLSVVDAHRQAYDMSCIPSSVEMVLKLLGRVPQAYYKQQDAWKNKADGNFKNYDGKTIEGVTFKKQFGLDRNEKFPLKELFATIERELDAGRFVIISLASSGGWHMYVIYAKDKSGDFIAVSKTGERTIQQAGIKEIVTQMKGTDILTYQVAH